MIGDRPSPGAPTSPLHFRAWTGHQMLYSARHEFVPVIGPKGSTLDGILCGGRLQRDGSLDVLAEPLMQSTGMVDRHGSEIYDLDYVGAVGTRLLVEFDHLDGQWIASTDDGETVRPLRELASVCEVIGSEYEVDNGDF